MALDVTRDWNRCEAGLMERHVACRLESSGDADDRVGQEDDDDTHLPHCTCWHETDGADLAKCCWCGKARREVLGPESVFDLADRDLDVGEVFRWPCGAAGALAWRITGIVDPDLDGLMQRVRAVRVEG